MKHDKMVAMLCGAALAAACSAGSALAGGLPDLGGGSMDYGNLASGSAGNAAGVIEYCVRNNYLGGDAASTMKDKLMGKAGLGGDSRDEDYGDGANGIVKTGDGRRVDLGKLGGGVGGVGDMKAKLTKKACGAVLDHAKSLL